MKTGPKGLDLIKRFEGLRTRAYQDSVGVWTIGYGHTAAAGDPKPVAGMVLTVAECEAILKRDLAKYEREVSSLVKVPLSQEQFDALVSFHFNTGALGRSTLLKRLNAGDYAAVPSELRKWTKAGGKVLAGLVKRREAEAALFMSASPVLPDVEPSADAPKIPPGIRLINWLRSLFA